MRAENAPRVLALLRPCHFLLSAFKVKAFFTRVFVKMLILRIMNFKNSFAQKIYQTDYLLQIY